MFQVRKLSELKKHPKNPRVIKDKQFETLCKSIKENPDYFNARPIILSDRTGELVIIAGNQRYEASKKVGLKEVPTYLLSGLTEAKEKEITIRDNVNNGEWDFDILANDFDDLDLSGLGLDMSYLSSIEEQEEKQKKDLSNTLNIVYEVIIDCVNEKEQEKVFNQMTSEGYKCRISTL
jgi:ParB-like chromosome segregation protein Spo0J